MAKTPPPNPARLPGPSPLPLHLGLAGLMWLNWPLLWQRLQPGSTDSKPVWSPALQQRAAGLAAAAARLPTELWLGALIQEGQTRYRDYLSGIALYHAQSTMQPEAQTGALPLMLQQIGPARLLDYAPQLTNAPAMLAIPSLVNRARILDLGQDFSLLRWLTAQNIRPLLLDWGDPGPADAAMTVSGYVERLQQFLPMLQHSTGGKPLHLFGHCLGGNLALALAAIAPQYIRSLILCSTPWDFHAGDPALGRSAAQLWRQMEPGPETALVPPAMLQTLFAMLQPAAVTQKFRRLAREAPAPERLQHFALVESWLNDGVAIARPVLREIILDWYGANLPLRGGWRVGDSRIRPRSINLPTLIAVPEQDHIVPPASAAALARQLPCARLWPMPLGHIGMIVSRRARQRVWRGIADWIVQHAESS